MSFNIGEEGSSKATKSGVLSVPPRLQRGTSNAEMMGSQPTVSESKVLKKLPAPNAKPEPEEEVSEEKQEETPVPAAASNADWDALAEQSQSDGKKLSKTELAARGFTETPVPVLKKGGALVEKDRPKRKPRVMIDAGHGGQDPGTKGTNGTHEKMITLEYARALGAALESTGRYEVFLTRSDDRYIMLRERLALGRKAKADLFISLHADSAPNSATRGLSLYTLSDSASDKEAAALAQRENKVDVIFGMNFSAEEQDVAEILIDLAQRETNNKSEKLAAVLIKAIKDQVQLLQNAHRHAGFAVLKAPDVPSVLIELGFLSNRKDEALLASRNYRDRIVKGLVAGVDKYFAGQKIQ